MQHKTLTEAQRQLTICNACRYCEGYCAVFPEITRHTEFGLAEVAHLANLCHDCRGCYYACQFTAPHEFDLNIPNILAEARYETWIAHARPGFLAQLFQKSGAALSLAMIVGITALFRLAEFIGTIDGGQGFYAVMSHTLMMTIFVPAFLLPLAAMAMGLKSYWQSINGTRIGMADIIRASKAALTMKNLSGGQAQGCNYEDEDRTTDSRRRAHQLTMYGFLLCFAATVSATILHYGFDRPAPYPLFSLPKLFGIPGGLMLSVGTLGLMLLKFKSDTKLDAKAYQSGSFAFVMLLFLVSTSGLLLYGFGWQNFLVAELLAIHLGSVLTLFILTPYSKMAHGFYRFAALLRDAQRTPDRDSNSH